MLKKLLLFSLLFLVGCSTQNIVSPPSLQPIPPQLENTNNLNLSWNNSISPEAIGNKIYYGYNSRNYTANIDVGNVTNYNLILIGTNLEYYMAATCYDLLGNESDYSEEVKYP